MTTAITAATGRKSRRHARISGSVKRQSASAFATASDFGRTSPKMSVTIVSATVAYPIPDVPHSESAISVAIAVPYTMQKVTATSSDVSTPVRSSCRAANGESGPHPPRAA